MNSSGVNEIVTDFNNVLLDLVKNISSVCPNSIIGKNKDDIVSTIEDPKYFTKFVDIFVAKVLIYKKYIDAGDDKFFLNELDDKKIEEAGASNDQIFQFKTIWHKLKRKNKDMVIQYMQVLADLGQEYFIMIDNC